MVGKCWGRLAGAMKVQGKGGRQLENRYRRLTNIEYARLQGFADDHCNAETVYHQYELFGNAVPPPLVEWVLRRLNCEGLAVADLPAQPEWGSMMRNSARRTDA